MRRAVLALVAVAVAFASLQCADDSGAKGTAAPSATPTSTASSVPTGDTSSKPSSPDDDGYHVKRGYLRDRQGRALILRGANLSGKHKWPPYFDFHTSDDFKRLPDKWGMNAVRLLVSWAAIEPTKGQYDTEYLDGVKQRMTWARDAGVMVVLDMHQDVYGEGFIQGGGNGAPTWSCDSANYESFVPDSAQWYMNYLKTEVINCYDHFWQTDEIRQHYINAWKKLAAHLGGFEDTILGFDPMNEPYWGSYALVAFEADLLQPFYEQVVPEVRKVQPNWVAFLEPAATRNLGLSNKFVKFPFEDVVYAPHCYDRDAEAGMGFDSAHRTALLKTLSDLSGEATALNAALWVGEYGGVAANPGIVEYMDAQYDGMSAVLAGATYWEYGKNGGYGLLDEDGSEKKDLLDTLVRPWAERVAGDPISSSFDEQTSTYALKYKPISSITVPSILRVPDRVYPNGYSVDCSGCTFTKKTGVLEIVKPAKGDAVSVVIHP